MTVCHKQRLPLSALIFLVVAALALAATAAHAQRLNWKELDPKYVPTGRDDHMMAFDSDLGLIVLFGGDNAGAETWIWDGETWRDLGLEETPAARRESAMVYDSVRKRIVLFGGYDYTILNNVTWQLDLSAKVWEGEIPDDSPEGRADFAMAFHEGIGLTIMQGGDGLEGDTWAFDGEEWNVIVEEDDGPGQRWGHTMAYDSKRQVIVLFGGVNADSELTNETWEFDGETWTNVTPDGVSPPAMRDHAMVYDSFRGVTVVFGGRDEESEGFNQTWEWDGESWTEIVTPDTPAPRHELQMAYDSWRHQIIMFGGSSGDLPDNRFKSDTWSYPNNPPVVQDHQGAPIGVVPGDEVKLYAKITDFDNDQVEAYIFYRTAGETEYQSAPMEFVDGRTYSGVVPGEDVNTPTLEYYIGATDPAGSDMFGYWRGPEEPLKIAVSETGRLQVFIQGKPARKRGAQWRVVGTEEWHSPGDTIKLPPGDYEIRFLELEKFIRPSRLDVTIISGQLTRGTGYYTHR